MSNISATKVIIKYILVPMISILAIVFIYITLTSAQEIINASDILSNLSAENKIEYIDAIIEGDIDICNLDLPQVKTERTSFERNLGILDTFIIINSSIFFINCTFKGDVDFRNAQFKYPVKFYSCNFDNSLNFDGACFLQNAYFGKSTFAGSTYFDGCYFSEEAYFGWNHFEGQTYFRSCRFFNMAYFMQSEFNNNAYFFGSIFNEDANFAWSKFNNYAEFGLCKFTSCSNFWKVQFLDIGAFDGSKFNETTFLDARFKEDAYFLNAFINNVNLTRVKFDRIFISWKSIEILDYDESTYIALMKNYQVLGWYSDYNDCYYDYRKESLGKSPLDYMEWVFYGFGVKPSYPAIWSVIIIVSFCFLYRAKGNLQKFKVIEIYDRTYVTMTSENFEIKEIYIPKKTLSLIDPLIFSLSSFTSNFTSFLQPSTEYKIYGAGKRLAILERLLGSIFIALIVATISKTWLIR